MIKRFRSFIDREFAGYPESKQLSDLKEELVSVLMDKYNDGLENGMNELDSYSKAIESMSDLRAQYKDEMDALHFTKDEVVAKTINTFIVSILYFLGLTIVFLVLQLTIGKKGEPAWLVWPLGAMIYVVSLFVMLNQNGKLSKSKLLKRGSIYGIGMSLATLLYMVMLFGHKVFPSMPNLAHPGWLIFPFAVSCCLILSALLVEHKKAFKIVLLAIAAVLLVAFLQLFLMFVLHIPNSWLVYLVAVFAAFVALSIKVMEKPKSDLKKRKNEKE